MIAGCCVAFLLLSEAYKAWIRPAVARSEKAAVQRIKHARQGTVMSDGLELVVVNSSIQRSESDLDAAAATEEEATAAEPAVAVAFAVQGGKALAGAAKSPMMAQ